MSLIGRLLPWTDRKKRKEAIRDAAQEKHQSRRNAAEARKIERQIRHIAETNHFAEKIAEQLIAQGWRRAD